MPADVTASYPGLFPAPAQPSYAEALAALPQPRGANTTRAPAPWERDDREPDWAATIDIATD